MEHRIFYLKGHGCLVGILMFRISCIDIYPHAGRGQEGRSSLAQSLRGPCATWGRGGPAAVVLRRGQSLGLLHGLASVEERERDPGGRHALPRAELVSPKSRYPNSPFFPFGFFLLSLNIRKKGTLIIKGLPGNPEIISPSTYLLSPVTFQEVLSRECANGSHSAAVPKLYTLNP